MPVGLWRERCTQRWSIRGSLKVRGLSILRTSFEFIRGHCGKVANKAPPDRETGASAQAAIHLRHRVVVVLMLLNFNTGQFHKSCSFTQASACYLTRGA